MRHDFALSLFIDMRADVFPWETYLGSRSTPLYAAINSEQVPRYSTLTIHWHALPAGERCSPLAKMLSMSIITALP